MLVVIRNCHDCGKPFTDGRSRCIGCRILRRSSDKESKREKAEAAFPPTVRTKLLALLRSGMPMGEACAQLEVSTVQAYGYRAFDPLWSVRLDAALMEGRDPDLKHGRPGAYRRGCRCPDCRAGKRAAGDWDR